MYGNVHTLHYLKYGAQQERSWGGDRVVSELTDKKDISKYAG